MCERNPTLSSFPVTLNPGQSAILNLQFQPAATGAVTGELSITSNSSTNPKPMISLSGTGTTTAHSVDLSWNAPVSSTDPVAGYHVYRSPGGSASYQLMNSTIDTQTAYVDSTVQSGQAYDYIVKSVDAAGVESAPSNVTSVTIP
jgi:fibronectin type 3 domain-containing protein